MESAAHNSKNSESNAGSNVSHIKEALFHTPDVVKFNEEKQECEKKC